MNDRAFRVFRELSDKCNVGISQTVFTWATEQKIEMTVGQVNDLADMIKNIAEHRGRQSFDVGRQSEIYNRNKEGMSK